MGLFRHRSDDGCFDELDRDALVRTERRADQMRDYRQYYSNYGDDYDQVYGGVLENDPDDPLRGYDDGSVDERIRNNKQAQRTSARNLGKKTAASEASARRRAAAEKRQEQARERERLQKEARERRARNREVYNMDKSSSFGNVPPSRDVYGTNGTTPRGRGGGGLFILGLIIGFILGIVVAIIIGIAALTSYGINGGLDDITKELGIYDWSDSDSTDDENKILDTDTINTIENLGWYINNYYYEDVDIEDLRNGVISGLFSNLDDYSRYYTAEEYQKLYEDSISGSYCGIGAQLQLDPDTGIVSIIHVYDESPAKESGLKDGDQIITVINSEGEYTATGADLTDTVSHIRGEEGTVVTLEIYRPSSSETLTIDITRRQLAFETVSSEMLENSTGYIQISEFAESTVNQFEKAVDDLSAQGAKSLIIDLRSNPGGSLDAVEEMADYILDDDQLIVYMADKDDVPYDAYYSNDGHSVDLPIVVLVDENSASASEIMTAALKDNGAAYVIGTTTFGKGVVQTVRMLSDGGGFKITTSRYFTPSGVCIHGIGIDPDYELEFEFLGGEDEEYSKDLDNQIQYAIEYLNK